MPYHANSGSFKKGEHRSSSTEFKKGQHPSLSTEFKKGNRLSPESSAKRIASMAGHVVSEITKIKISRATSHPKNISEHGRQLLRERRLRQVLPRKDTVIEIKIQQQLHALGIPYRLHENLLGQPDIFIPDRKLCIFADGCYWHKCYLCGFGQLRERDVEVLQKLQDQGYMVIRIWEHDIKSPDFRIDAYIKVI